MGYYVLWLVIGILIGAGFVYVWLDRKVAERQSAVEAHYEGRLKHLQDEVVRADQAHEDTKEKLRELMADRNTAAERTSAAEKELTSARREADAARREQARLERQLAELRTNAERAPPPTAERTEPPHDLPVVPVPPSSPPAVIDETTQRLRSIDARLKMLPAGSSARTSLLAERQQLLGKESGSPVVARAVETEPRSSSTPPTFPPAPVDVQPDNLEVIKGIGPRIHRELESMGIVTFAQLAVLSPEQIRAIEEKFSFPGRVGRQKWVEQARERIARR
jgi:predicted flap endonuclease-1-like 5' DNA nuclease